ncbi:MAG: D-alanyl-D-alanine carboxypeptidase [Proteobacteria bacterium]|nr:D-alanyl-D-alanine carboxypeptidase [Pseudomonadota bacterium]MBU1715805.1 D-alanyl-D-alanine carboxypeptidase [Pseudomonadota bacterium]
MTIPVRKLLVLLFLFFFSLPGVPAYSQSSSSQSFSKVLKSIHKSLPADAAQSRSAGRHQRSIVNLTDDSDIKRKPRNGSNLSAQSVRRKISSRSALVIDSETGDIVYAQAPDVAAQPASTIKIITGLLALQSLEKTDLVKTSRKAAEMPRSKIYLKRGKSYPADDLINAVLLSSANDASVALAEKIAGSERIFAKLMTYKAKIWGARNTVCKTATGLTVRGQKSTVRDLAVIFNKAMENEEFARKMATSKVRTKDGKMLRTHNRALWTVDGTEGGKTGYTNAARQTYVGKFSRDGIELTVAIMGSETMWDDIYTLVEYGFAKKIEEGAVFAQDSSDHDSVLTDMTSPKQGYSLQVISEINKISHL